MRRAIDLADCDRVGDERVEIFVPREAPEPVLGSGPGGSETDAQPPVRDECGTLGSIQEVE
jgi:hypothetical protein